MLECKSALPLKKVTSIDLNRLHFKTLDENTLGRGADETRFERRLVINITKY